MDDVHLDPASQELSLRIQAELDDVKRLEVAEVLRGKIEAKVKAAYQKKDPLAVYTKSASEADGKHLLGLAQRILTENHIPRRADGKNLDTKELGHILLYML